MCQPLLCFAVLQPLILIGTLKVGVMIPILKMPTESLYTLSEVTGLMAELRVDLR